MFKRRQKNDGELLSNMKVIDNKNTTVMLTSIWQKNSMQCAPLFQTFNYMIVTVFLSLLKFYHKPFGGGGGAGGF